MYHVSAQGIDERMINVHYYYYYYTPSMFTEIMASAITAKTENVALSSFCSVPAWPLQQQVMPGQADP